MFQSIEMCENLPPKNSKRTELKKSTLSAVDSHVRTLVARVNALALLIARGTPLGRAFGRSTLDSLAKLSPNGSWLKMSGGCCQSLLWDDQGEDLELFSRTWPTWGMMRSGVVMGLPMLVRPTKENECLSWRTPDANLGARGPKSAEMYDECKRTNKHALNLIDQVKHLKNWPTPRANKIGGSTSEGYGLSLGEAVNGGRGQNWSTPQASLRGDCQSERNRNTPGLVSVCKTEGQKGNLNADWVEILMGLPVGWTDVDTEPQEWPGWPAPMNGQQWGTHTASHSVRSEEFMRGAISPAEFVAKGIQAGQYSYEPPRVIVGQKNRAKRLKCLGNGCVPQQVYPIFKAIMEVEKQMG